MIQGRLTSYPGGSAGRAAGRELAGVLRRIAGEFSLQYALL